ncbi:MAG: EAL domain-containing protein [Chloroflexi bacterium]|nr:EAL domain-containing protein [Chloroflexota bacterium]
MPNIHLRPTDLSGAIAGNELSLHYLPQVKVTEGRLDGVECFLRWPHPALGMVGPADIAEIVREGAMHAELDRWVVGTATRQLRDWRSAGVEIPRVCVSVWRESLGDRGFVESVIAAAAGGSLEIKCPRGALAEPGLRALADGGVRIATDVMADEDPGELRIATLKIPPGVVRELDGNEDVVRRTVAVAATHGMRVVAEGVETVAQQDALVALGCVVVQGYLYGPEAPAEEITKLVVAGGA